MLASHGCRTMLRDEAAKDFRMHGISFLGLRHLPVCHFEEGSKSVDGTAVTMRHLPTLWP